MPAPKSAPAAVPSRASIWVKSASADSSFFCRASAKPSAICAAGSGRIWSGDAQRPLRLVGAACAEERLPEGAQGVGALRIELRRALEVIDGLRRALLLRAHVAERHAHAEVLAGPERCLQPIRPAPTRSPSASLSCPSAIRAGA